MAIFRMLDGACDGHCRPLHTADIDLCRFGGAMYGVDVLDSQLAVGETRLAGHQECQRHGALDLLFHERLSLHGFNSRVQG
jgi:hypothetical protein